MTSPNALPLVFTSPYLFVILRSQLFQYITVIRSSFVCFSSHTKTSSLVIWLDVCRVIHAQISDVRSPCTSQHPTESTLNIIHHYSPSLVMTQFPLGDTSRVSMQHTTFTLKSDLSPSFLLRPPTFSHMSFHISGCICIYMLFVFLFTFFKTISY